MIANHLWQSTAFAAAAALLALALRGNRARTRHWVWIAASLKFLLPFAMLAALGSVAGSRTPARPIVGAKLAAQVEVIVSPTDWGNAPVLPRPALPLAAIAYAVWACGSLFLAVRWWKRWRGMRALARAARPLEMPLPIPVRSSAATIEPGVFGIFRPVLLLPECIAERLAPAQLQAILAHELSHVRRRDNFWAALHMLVETLFWFHPLVWWIGARLVEERERACDEAVLESGGEPEAYAEGILAACKLYLESPLECVAGVSGGGLRNRIERIMGEWAPRELSAARRALLAVAGILVIGAPVAIGFLRAPVVRAQAQDRPKFDVASIKLDQGEVTFSQDPTVRGRRVIARASTLLDLITSAYAMRYDQVSGGPSWARSDHYDIDAEAEGEGPLTAVESRQMVQGLLADRFQLKVHRETRDLPIYLLIVAKSGPKLRSSTADASGRNFVRASEKGLHMEAAKGTMEQLARQLSGTAGRPVIDRTALAGYYAYTLDWFPANGVPPPDLDIPSMFEALREQLGLKLESGKGPVEVMVIDHVERPSEN